MIASGTLNPSNQKPLGRGHKGFASPSNCSLSRIVCWQAWSLAGGNRQAKHSGKRVHNNQRIRDGKLTGVKVQEIDWKPASPQGGTGGGPGRPIMVEKGKPEIIKAELVLLAMGFLKPEHPEYPKNVFVCGDSANGASLVVRAMASGKQTAKKVRGYLGE